jgi:hypothetical protein
MTTNTSEKGLEALIIAQMTGGPRDYDAVQLRELAKRSDDIDQTRRLPALAAV